MKKIAIALAIIIPLSGCTSLASFTANVATELSSSTPTQVKTLADAERVATLATKAATIAVDTGKFSRAQLLQLQKLNDGLHVALVDLNAANKEGNSLVYAGFNAALDAFNAYATSQGIAH